MLVEIEASDDAGIDTIEAVDIPGSAARVGADGRTWFQRTGDAWLERGEALILLAPSLVSPRDRNAMLNPAHPGMKDVRVLHVERFRLDPRLALSGSEDV
jgi:RES domain-containing protein